MQPIDFIKTIFEKTNESGYLIIASVEDHDWDNTLKTYDFAISNGKIPDAVQETFEKGDHLSWYFMPQLFSSTIKKKENVIEGAALWVDLDNTTISPFEFEIPPSIIIETSPKKYHCYWLLNQAYPSVVVEEHCKKLVYGLGGDIGTWNSNRFMRLPCGVNNKYEDIFEPSIKRSNDTIYSLDRFVQLKDPPEKIRELFEDLPIPEERSIQSILNRVGDILPSRLNQILYEKEVDRSKALWFAYHEFYRLDIDKEDAFWLLFSSPNNKFSSKEHLWNDLLNGYVTAEKKSVNQTVIERIKNIKAARGSSQLRLESIIKIIIEDMLKNGWFFCTTENEYYYLDSKKTGQLYPVSERSDKIQKLLLDRYTINAGSYVEYKQVITELTSRCLDNEPINIHTFSYYDQDRLTLYINAYNDKIYRLDGENFTLLNNGEDGVVFKNISSVKNYKIEDQFYKKQPKLESTELYKQIIGSVNIEEDEDAVRKIIFSWICSLFFPELLPIKPILFAHGIAGSGKTALFKAISTILVGPDYIGPQDLPTKQEDFDIQLTNKQFVFFDNVDEYKPWLANKLALAATKYSFDRRKLYKDSEIIHYVVSCFIGITARTPKFISRRHSREINTIQSRTLGTSTEK